jgi:hypothetical protein
MPIQLTASYNSGDINGSLTHVKIAEMKIVPDAKRIEAVARMGKIVGGVFQYGVAIENVTTKHFTIEGADYDTMIAETSAAADEVYYDEEARLLYEWLIANNHFAGTIV